MIINCRVFDLSLLPTVTERCVVCITLSLSFLLKTIYAVKPDVSVRRPTSLETTGPYVEFYESDN